MLDSPTAANGQGRPNSGNLRLVEQAALSDLQIFASATYRTIGRWSSSAPSALQQSNREISAL